jgi:hypothetical protein
LLALQVAAQTDQLAVRPAVCRPSVERIGKRFWF